MIILYYESCFRNGPSGSLSRYNFGNRDRVYENQSPRRNDSPRSQYSQYSYSQLKQQQQQIDQQDSYYMRQTNSNFYRENDDLEIEYPARSLGSVSKKMYSDR